MSGGDQGEMMVPSDSGAPFEGNQAQAVFEPAPHPFPMRLGICDRQNCTPAAQSP